MMVGSSPEGSSSLAIQYFPWRCHCRARTAPWDRTRTNLVSGRGGVGVGLGGVPSRQNENDGRKTQAPSAWPAATHVTKSKELFSGGIPECKKFESKRRSRSLSAQYLRLVLDTNVASAPNCFTSCKVVGCGPPDRPNCGNHSAATPAHRRGSLSMRS